jgi:predicted regulator of Ras-like GTPase activity (Roadblock/LC7/MglB family)
MLVGGKGSCTHPELTWTVGAGNMNPNDIYGFYVVDGDGLLICCSRDPNAPRNMTMVGNQIKITLTLTDTVDPA